MVVYGVQFCTVVHSGLGWCVVVYGGVHWCEVVYSGVWLNVGACLVQNDDGSLQTKVQTPVQKATSPNLRQTAVQKVCSFTVVCGGVWWCAVVCSG